MLILSKSQKTMKYSEPGPEMSKNIMKRKKNFIWSWEDRINTELCIIESLGGTLVDE